MSNILFNTAKPLATAALLCGLVTVAQVAVKSTTGITVGAAFAQEQTRKTPAMSNAFYEKLAKAQESVEAKDYASAIAALDDMKRKHDAGKSKLNSYEMANLYTTYAFIYYSQEKFPAAIKANEEVLKQADIPLGLELSTRYTIAQLYFVIEDYSSAVKALEAWFQVEQNPTPDAYMLLAQGYYQTESYDKALKAVETGMEIAAAAGKEPKEQWYMLMRALYFQQNDLNKMAWVMEEMARLWPKREYFVQLSSAYAQINKEKRQLAAHDVAYMGWGLDSESSMLNMGYLYMGNEVPYYGAKVIEKGLKQGNISSKSKYYTTLAQAYSLAQESKKAVPYLEKAAELADDGEPWAQLAGVYYDIERYNDSVKAAQTALDKGGVKRPENTYVLMGMAYFNLENFSEAKKQFTKAKDSKSTANVATQWIKYINREIRRREELKKV